MFLRIIVHSLLGKHTYLFDILKGSNSSLNGLIRIQMGRRTSDLSLARDGIWGQFFGA